MLVINYNGNKPTSNYFKHSVEGNNNADTIRFIVSLNQSGVVLNDNYHFYAKVQCVDDNYYDKVLLENVEIDTDNNLLKADFVLKAQHTSHKQIEVSLSCENFNDQIVWQTQLVKVSISSGINADEEIEDQYPTVLQNLQQQIDEMGGGGGAYKTIVCELLPSAFNPNNEKCFRSSLRLHFINFAQSDIGSSIHLYNKSLHYKCKIVVKRPRKYLRKTIRMAYKHPANYDSDQTNIQKLGFGVIAGRKTSIFNHFYYWCDVPTFMIHNGFVQTEYEITAQHIEQGYMDIDIGKEFMQLLRPNTSDQNNFANNHIYFNNRTDTFGRGQYIAFYQVKDGVVKVYPKNQLYVKTNTERDINSMVSFDSNGEYRLAQAFNIKVIPY